MGIYIKGMEMPREGYKVIYVHSNGSVYQPSTAENIWQKIASAVPVPPHGDLIDAEEEMRLMQSYDYDTYDDYSRAFDMLDNAPTIIPAEEGE